MEASSGPQVCYREELSLALASVFRPGTFSCGGSLRSFSPPGLEVPGVGSIGLPLTAQQAHNLASQGCLDQRAGIYVKCLQLLPRHFSLAGLDWERQVDQIVNESVKPSLRLPKSLKVEPRLNKLLLYEAGGYSKCYTWDKDKKAVDSFGTLMFVLPTAHAGGELVVRYAGLESTFAVAREGLYNIHYAAFFADCEHEILPIQTGYLLMLVYDLFTQGSTCVTQPADNTSAVTTIQEMMSDWSEDPRGPQKLVIPLAHRYTERSLFFENLRGTDTAKLDALLQASESPGGQLFHIHLGLLQVKSSLPSSYQGQNSPSMDLIHMRGCRGEQDWNHPLEINREELLPGTALYPLPEVVEPEELLRRYVTYEAAAVIWPQTRHWDMRSTSNPLAALAEASSLSEVVTALPRLLEAACLTTGHLSSGEAQTVADLVFEHGQVYAVTELSCALKALAVHAPTRLFGPPAIRLVHLIIRHGDVELAKAFLEAYVSQSDRPLFQPGIAPPLAVRFGWEALGPLIVRAVLQASAFPHFHCGLRLLLEIAPPETKNGSQEAGTADSCPVIGGKKKVDPPGGRGTSDGQMSDHPDSERAAVSRQALDAVVAKICGGEARYLLNLNRYEPTPGLQDVQVIGQYLRVVERFGWEVLAPATEVIVRESIHNLEPAVDFLSTMMAAGIELKQAANLQLGQDSLKKLSVVAERFHRYYASKFVDALLNEEDPPFVPGPSSSPPARRHDFVENLMKALDSLAFSGDVKKAVVAHFFATPKLHDLDETLLPAVEGLLEHLGSHFKGGSWFLQLYWRCMDALETRCVKPPPLDVWVLPTACACACRGCRQLVQFCMDPFRVQIELPCPGRDAKEHLIDSVQRNRMPIVISNEESAFESDFVPLACIKKGAEEDFDQKIVDRHSKLEEEYETNMSKIEDMRAWIGERCGLAWALINEEPE